MKWFRRLFGTGDGSSGVSETPKAAPVSAKQQQHRQREQTEADRDSLRELGKAIRDQNLALVQKILRANRHLAQSRFPDGLTALHFSIALPALGSQKTEYSLAIVRAVLEAGADVDAVCSLGESVSDEFGALHRAAVQQDLDFLRLLLNNCADPNRPLPCGETALHGAARGGNVEIGRLLLECGAMIEARDKLQNTPLVTALIDACNNPDYNVSFIKFLLDSNASVNARDKDGYTPLFFAVFNRRREIVDILLDKGADPNIQDPYTGATPLHLAASKGLWYEAEQLLKHGANPNVQSKDCPGARAGTPLAGARGERVMEILRRYGGHS